MEYVLTPRTNGFDWCFWEGAFSEKELDIIQQLAQQASRPGLVGGQPTPNTDVRRSYINWLYNDSENGWIYNKLSHVCSSLNASFYNFQLTGFGEPLQISNYVSDIEGTYDWHMDVGQGASRKLSMVLQLTDPSEYEGGELQVLMGKEYVTVKKERGIIIAFPSFMLHRVTPVTKGNRQSLVAWISGEPFR